ncbi:MAG: hypothetical protein KGJ13_03350 [Patescibacteria group bacterium]|nr:hypothetical protein [Patescibacteria group bacterium]
MDSSRSGQAFLALTLLISAIVIVVGATIAFITIAFIDSSYGLQAAGQANAAALSGVEDAALNLERYGLAWNPGPSNTYTLSLPAGSATITFTPDSPTPDLATVVSAAVVQNRTQKIRAVFAVNPTTGQVALVSADKIQ